MRHPQNNSIAVRIQRNIFSKLSHPALLRHVISDTYVRLLDVIYTILKQYYSEEIAEKVIRKVVKTVVKLALVFREDKSLEEHEYALDDLQNKVRTLLLTIHSFDQLKHSYSQSYLLKLLDETEESLQLLVKQTLSEKSSQRIIFVFQHFRNTHMLDSFFRPDSPHIKERNEFMEVIADLQF